MYPAASKLLYSTGVAPPDPGFVQPFPTKLDAAGANVLYSVPIGGAGVALGSQGDVYVGGAYTDAPLGFLAAPAPRAPRPLGVASLPEECSANPITSFSQGTVSHVNGATGNVLDTVLVGSG